MPRTTVAALLLLGLALAPGDAASSGELQGVVTQVEGAVEASGPGVSRLPLISPWQVVRAGVTLRVPAGGAAGIVCSNRRFVRLRGPVSWKLAEPACAAGKELTPAEYALVVPQGGRFKVVEGLLVLEHGVRSSDGDDPLAPVVLRPRNTVLRSPRPEISWIQVPSVTEYQIEWTGRGTSGYDVLLRAGEVVCSEGREGLPICSLPWPEDRPDLAPGEIFFLHIAARSGIAEPWHANDPVEVRTQEIRDAVTLESELRDLEKLDLQGAALDAARSGLLAERELYTDAAELYRRALAAAPAPELRITLADVYVVMGLYLLAEPHYLEALREEEPAVRAAASFGLGRIAYARGRYGEAANLFRQAVKGYSRLRLGEEKEAAQQATERANARSGEGLKGEKADRDLR